MTLFINSAVAIIIFLILGRSILLAIKDKQSIDAFTSRIKNIQNHEDLIVAIRSEQLLGSAGQDYLSTLINFESDSITNINSSEYFFMENITANKGFGRLKLNATAFVSIGVLGTFIGLALGLSSIDTTVGADRLAEQIDELLKNVSTSCAPAS